MSSKDSLNEFGQFYNVELALKYTDGGKGYLFAFDLDQQELKRLIVNPYCTDQKIFIDGKLVSRTEIDRILISESFIASRLLRSAVQTKVESLLRKDPLHSAVAIDSPEIAADNVQLKTSLQIMRRGTDVTDNFINSVAISKSNTETNKSSRQQAIADRCKVFVVHGRNERARDAMFTFLRAIGLSPTEWTEAVGATNDPAPYIGDILNSAFSKAQAIVVLMTPDDVAYLHKVFRHPSDPDFEIRPTGQARPNVLFEAGLAMGVDDKRTVLVELGELRPFSDIAGRFTVRIDDTTQRRQDLALRLKSAGCTVNLDGTDWHTSGDFESALSLIPLPDMQDATTEHLQLSDDAITLLRSAINSTSCTIDKIEGPGHDLLHTEKDTFGKADDIRSQARWWHALRELVDHGLVSDLFGDEVSFQVTHDGFQASDKINGVDL